MAEQQTEIFQALVFGASGITGYALLSQLLSYPTPTTFDRIIGVTRRPLHRDVAQLPEDQRLELYSDLDLTDRNQALFSLQHIPGIEHTTHVYYAAYAGHGSDYQELKRINVEMLTNAVGSCEICCPNLRFFTLQTGGKAYGVEFADKVDYNPPLSESLPRIPDPYAQNIFYYEQYDIMKRASAGKPWTFCEIRPDAIVGFVPQNNAMNIAQAVGLFLSMWKAVEGEGSAVPFPGSTDAWTALHTDTSQDILARFHIHASLLPLRTSGRAFNVVDGPATTWEAVWPEVCAYFGLRGTAPEPSSVPFNAQEWMESRSGEWSAWVAKHALRDGALEGTTWSFMQAVIGIPFRRDYDPTASREIGFTEERPHAEGYKRVFEEMRRARFIPSSL
ncbi:hypothetical protein LTR36_008835 [Oleoguttula mirabilis]|uniref:PRISE-like Rossmann-fold domain-containing protein n=1 Tax=Oleoguttula mirabilis TaxID=1507867 RepID=A0AAV9J817_9PEZI|nr:hypothetical protein LTR36_008835 [Oleoguttula mirabilis]